MLQRQAALNLEQGEVTGVGTTDTLLLHHGLQVSLRRVDPHLHVSDLVTDHLVVCQTFTKGLAILSPLNGFFQTNA